MKVLKTYEEKCIGCSTCVTACSNLYFKEDDPEKSCIELFPQGNDIFKLSVCNQCGTCVEACPAEALSMGADDVPEVDMDRCFGCGVCATGCPSEAIALEERPEAEAPPLNRKALKEAIKASRA